MEDRQTQDPIAELIKNYHELNSSVIEELAEEPSPLEFMRFVARNTPFVVRGAAADWQATRTWTVDFLKEYLGDTPVNVAVTPAGNADAPTLWTDPADSTTTRLVFAKPHEEDQPFSAFLTYLTTQELTSATATATASSANDDTAKKEKKKAKENEIRYAQTQNDNLRHEYAALLGLGHVPASVPWARVALARAPDAVNLWIGNSRSATALHRDGYENVYVQLRGRKHFVLLPPACHACVNETRLRPAVYRRRTQTRHRCPLKPSSSGLPGGQIAGEREEGEGEEEEEEEDGGLELVLEEVRGQGETAGEGDDHDDGTVPFPIWDPDRPEENATKYSPLARPMRVTLNPGDMLYLPCMWYHKVSQSCSADGVCIAVNYWYDMEYSGPLYPMSTFVRSVCNKAK